MNGYRNWIRKTGAAILCAVFLLSCLVPAYAEETPATPTDLAEVTEAPEEETLFEEGDVSEEETPEEAPEPDEEPPFVQTLTAEGVRITVTADPGVFSADAELTVELTEDETFARAAEAVLGVTPGSSGIVLHRIYLFSGAEMNGSARVTMERLGLKELQAKNPGAEITLYAVSRERPEKAYLGIITDADFVKQYDETAYLEQLGKAREEMVGSMQWTDFSSEMIRRRIGGRETAGIKMSYVNERDVRTFTEVFAWQEEGRVNTLSVTSSMEDRCDLILGRFRRLKE